MREHPESRLLQPVDHVAEQQQVLEYTTRQRNGAQPGYLPQHRAHLDDGGRNPAVEPSGYDRRPGTGQQILGSRTHQVGAAHPQRAGTSAATGGTACAAGTLRTLGTS